MQIALRASEQVAVAGVSAAAVAIAVAFYRTGHRLNHRTSNRIASLQTLSAQLYLHSNTFIYFLLNLHHQTQVYACASALCSNTHTLLRELGLIIIFIIKINYCVIVIINLITSSY